MKLNWPLFILIAWILFGLELGLRPALQLGPTKIAPSFVLPLLVFVALSAPAGTVYWAALSLGLATDLTNSIPTRDGGDAVTIIGPYAVGYFLAGQVVMTLRSMMIRRNPLTLALLSTVGMAVAQLVIVIMFSIRSWYDDAIVWEAFHELFTRMGTALATGVSGLVLAFLLNPLGSTLGLHIPQQRRFPRRT